MSKRLGRLKRYFIFSKSGIQTTLAYRGQVALWFLGGVINAVLMGLLWWAIFSFSESDTVSGFTFPQMMMYVLLSTIVGEVTFSESMSSITDEVRYGTIGMRLMKPINYRAQLAFTGLGSFVARALIVGIPMTLVGTLVMVYGFGLGGITWYNILLFLPACFLAMLLNDAIDFLFGQLAFRTQAMFGVHSMSKVILGFLSGAMVPLAFFPMWAQTALMYTPFPSIMSFPVRLFLGQLAWADVAVGFGIAAAWTVLLNVIGLLLYKTSVRKVVVFGG